MTKIEYKDQDDGSHFYISGAFNSEYILLANQEQVFNYKRLGTIIVVPS
jgi:hypothetical protein